MQGLSLKGGLLYAGSDGANREAFNRDWNNVQPRIGVAWQPAQKWVVRGGYGLYYLGQNAVGAETGFSRHRTGHYQAFRLMVTPLFSCVNNLQQREWLLQMGYQQCRTKIA